MNIYIFVIPYLYIASWLTLSDIIANLKAYGKLLLEFVFNFLFNDAFWRFVWVKSVSRSVGWSVTRSVVWAVSQSVRQSVNQLVNHISEKWRITHFRSAYRTCIRHKMYDIANTLWVNSVYMQQIGVECPWRVLTTQKFQPTVRSITPLPISADWLTCRSSWNFHVEYGFLCTAQRHHWLTFNIIMVFWKIVDNVDTKAVMQIHNERIMNRQ